MQKQISAAIFNFSLRIGLIFGGLVLGGCGQPVPVDPSLIGPKTTPTVQPPPPPAEERYLEVKADVGVTHRADWEDSSEKPMSIITVPLATKFKVEEMSVFRMQIPESMKLYQAETGEFPKTEEEFMQNIIQKNQIILPKLPDGDSYFYAPETHELMVRTKQAPFRPK